MNRDLEQKLVLACRRGDKSAYTGLVKAYSQRVFAICFAMLGNSHDAEDMAQQSLLKGFTDINHLRNGQCFGAWIGRIARNLCIDFVRREKKHKQTTFIERIETGSSGSIEHPELVAALSKLSKEHRISLLLYYFDGRSTEAIAETLGINQAAVHTRLSRARKHLRELLDAEGGA